MVVKIRPEEDLRRYSRSHHDTQQWKALYNERTSVERCISRMKTCLTANRLHVRGIQKVKTHICLNAIVLLLSALIVAKQGQKEAVA
ncbi:hypothetical protein GCM10010965_30230 [Caldalkalibacillus thermarum]|nr:transposase [Caldalkalibacillus thermarum]GGK35196.1 hypothetical protein GCM10010965_30230 [Caldalkalibacillus thermarum]